MESGLFRLHFGRPVAGLTHQPLHRPMANLDSVAKAQLGVHPAGTVGAARVEVDLSDEVGQPRVPDRPLRRRAGPAVVEARLGDVEHATDELNRQACAAITSAAANRLLGRPPPSTARWRVD